MKQLKGMKKNISSLENKKLVDSNSIKGALAPSTVASNVYNSVGGGDIDYYDENGHWVGRLSWH